MMVYAQGGNRGRFACVNAIHLDARSVLDAAPQGDIAFTCCSALIACARARTPLDTTRTRHEQGLLARVVVLARCVVMCAPPSFLCMCVWGCPLAHTGSCVQILAWGAHAPHCKKKHPGAAIGHAQVDYGRLHVRYHPCGFVGDAACAAWRGAHARMHATARTCTACSA